MGTSRTGKSCQVDYVLTHGAIGRTARDKLVLLGSPAILAVFSPVSTAYNWPVQKPLPSRLQEIAMRMSYPPRALSILFVAFIMIPQYAHAQQQSGAQSLKFMNDALPVDQRVADLIGRM